MVHLYTGDGKGKTTAAMGLAIRAAGKGHKAVVVQFLKSDNSGEQNSLKKLENVVCIPLPTIMKFVWNMNEKEKEETSEQVIALFETAVNQSKYADLLILDELCGAISTDMIPLKMVLSFLDSCPETLDVVITGRDPDPEIEERADYYTEMKKRKHPFDKGIPAREGIEW